MTKIAYFEVQALPHVDPAAAPRRIPADPQHPVEQWDRLIAAADPALYMVAPHRADGVVVGADGPGATS